MSDRTAARIAIGGGIPRRSLDDLAQTIIEERLGAEYGEPFAGEADAIAQIKRCAAERQSLRLYIDGTRSGVFEELERLCRQLGLSYVRGDHGNENWSGHIEIWEPGMNEPRSWPCLVDNNVPHFDAEAIRQLSAAGRLGAELDLMDQAAMFDKPIAIAE